MANVPAEPLGGEIGQMRPGPDDASRVRSVVEAEFGFVWRSLRRLGVPERMVDDAAQQVFFVLARNAAHVEPGRERSYLFGVVRRVAADVRRLAHLRHEAGPEQLPTIADPRPDAEQMLDDKRIREMLDTLLDALTPDLREAFVLFEGEGLQVHEIADLLDLPAGTVASRLRRARAGLGEALQAVRERAKRAGEKP